MYAYVTDFSIDQTTPQSSSSILFTGTNKRETSHKTEKNVMLDSNRVRGTATWIRTTDNQVKGTAT